MSEIRTEQALHNRVERLRPRIESLVKSGALEKADAEKLGEDLGEALQAFGKFAQSPAEVEAQVAKLEVNVGRLESPPIALAQEQQEKAITASK